jgi:hypothetical protein
MDIQAIEAILWDAVEKESLNEDTVDEVVVNLRAAEADLIEAQNSTQDREGKLAVALDRFNQITSEVVLLLNKAANNY